MDLAKVVSTKELTSGQTAAGVARDKGHVTPENSEFHVVAYDFGAKRNILTYVSRPWL